MNVLVLNGSPKSKSDTMRITNSFLEGMNQNNNCEITVVDVIKKNINPCLGCFGCWQKQEGRCLQDDDQNEILELIKKADVLIWSFPLYYYGLPSHLKAVMDRTLPLAKMSMKDTGDRVVHDSQVDLSNQKLVVISGCGFPHFENNYKALKMVFEGMHPNHTSIYISEAPLLNVKELAYMVDPLLEKIKEAGKEFLETGQISKTTKETIETPLIPKEVYIKIINTQH